MSAADWQIISKSDLLDKDKTNDTWIRVYCHIHGGDHQRSLSINKHTGFGQCHKCGVQVLVKEFNPEAAANIAIGQERCESGEIKVRDPRFIMRSQSKPVTIEQWQLQELETLYKLQVCMHTHLDDERARSYVTERGISLETARQMHVGYIPADEWDAPSRWSDRLIFPVQSPTSGLQFVGRSLHLWKPGMDEEQHKELLEEKGTVKRWIKTHAAGWFNFQVLQDIRNVIFVEGAFDALALLDSGLLNVVSVIGTAVEASWIPKHVQHATIAFDGDTSGVEKSAIARDRLYERGFNVEVCNVPDDGRGKDWSERYRLHDIDGIKPLWAPCLAPDRNTYCCSAGWLWNGEQYVCQQCRGRKKAS